MKFDREAWMEINDAALAWRTKHHHGTKQNFPIGQIRLLGSEDGFPWCDIQPSTFTTSGINLRDVDRTEIDRILSLGKNMVYPEWEKGALSRFNPLLRMGIYQEADPVGFAYGGVVETGSAWFTDSDLPETAGEIGLIHVRPNLEQRGVGTVLFGLLGLRLIHLDSPMLLTYLSDKTGRMRGFWKVLALLRRNLINLTVAPNLQD